MTGTNEHQSGGTEAPDLPTITINGEWVTLLQGQETHTLARYFPAYLQGRRWFGGKARTINAVHIAGTLPLAFMDEQAYLSWLEVDYTDGDTEIYVLPLAFATGERARRLVAEQYRTILARVKMSGNGIEGILYDALVEPAFCSALLTTIGDGQLLQSAEGQLLPSTTGAFKQLLGSSSPVLDPRIVNAEQSNTSVIYGDRFIMKLFRRLESGINPDLEIGRFLTEHTAFAHVPPVAGALEYRPQDGVPMTLAILQGFVPNQGDAWSYTLEELEAYFKHTATEQAAPQAAALSTGQLLALAAQPLSPEAQASLGRYAESARLLGQRTGELHVALASNSTETSFAPELFTEEFQRAFHASSTAAARRAFSTLRNALAHLPQATQPSAQALLDREEAILDRFEPLLAHPLTALRIRCHGDYHLGQVLFTGQDFFIIDFEGEPARPLNERQRKSSALQDVAGMLRSLHYAPYAALRSRSSGPFGHPAEAVPQDGWARAWHRWASTAFLNGYLAATRQATFLPQTRAELQRLLDIYLLDKAIYEMVYELNNRPDWITIPLEGILQLLETAA
ncbi:MAG: putative maltokinase [Herpetosiphonaceae bacterium]|nr:putative maltokinase [Herpetosiphonaceae bacterium]